MQYWCDVCNVVLTDTPRWKVTGPAVGGERQLWSLDTCDKCKDAFLRDYPNGTVATTQQKGV